MTDKVYNVLFLCTGNSARSILAEALMTCEGQGRFKAWSAGPTPTGRVNPHTYPLLQGMGLDPLAFRSKSWDEFARPGAPEFDFIFTLCDDAAGEVCPAWPGQPMTAHWGMPDPAAVRGSEAEIAAAFSETARMLANRIRLFAELPIAALDRMSLHARLREIGETAAPPERVP